METLRAILLMILSMALLALSDMFIKLAASRLPVGQVMTLLSIGGTLFFLGLARLQRAPVWSHHFFDKMVMIRNGTEIVGAVCLVMALSTVPLPIFAAIMQIAPLVVTLGAALFLGEQVGWRRWAAIGVGMAGMLLILRPGGDGFSLDALWAVGGITALSARDLVTRLAPRDIPAISLATWGFGATIPAGMLVLLLSGAPMRMDHTGLTHVLGAIVVTSLGYYAITSAMRVAPASTFSPFRYSRLVFTTGLGIAVFGQWPDRMTLIGSALIILSGLYTFLREARLARSR